MKEQAERDQKRWQKTRKPLEVIGLIIVLIAAFTLIFVEIRVNGTGFKGKTLWDWLNLLGVLAIPVVVGFGVAWFTVRHNHDIELARAQHENDQRITLDNQRETVLQTYLDKMSELILHENLLNVEQGDKVRIIARARTLTALPQLDPKRKRSIILFLYESGLIDYSENFSEVKIDLSWADLREADLSQLKLKAASFVGADLQGANLSRATLSESNFSGADLQDANLTDVNLRPAKLTGAYLIRADLRRTDLSWADLQAHFPTWATILVDADLRGANLERAKVTTEQLKQAKSLEGAIGLDKIDETQASSSITLPCLMGLYMSSA